MAAFSASRHSVQSPAGTVAVGDIKMYYEVHGPGELLLLIMGLGGCILDWGLGPANTAR